MQCAILPWEYGLSCKTFSFVWDNCWWILTDVYHKKGFQCNLLWEQPVFFLFFCVAFNRHLNFLSISLFPFWCTQKSHDSFYFSTNQMFNKYSSWVRRMGFLSRALLQLLWVMRSASFWEFSRRQVRCIGHGSRGMLAINHDYDNAWMICFSCRDLWWYW